MRTGTRRDHTSTSAVYDAAGAAPGLVVQVPGDPTGIVTNASARVLVSDVQENRLFFTAGPNDENDGLFGSTSFVRHRDEDCDQD